MEILNHMMSSVNPAMAVSILVGIVIVSVITEKAS